MRLTYFDTSALVPLVVAEPSAALCLRLWNDSDAMVTASLAYVEVHSAVAQAARQGRLTETDRQRALVAFEARWDDLVRIAPDDRILSVAAGLSADHALRGYDAIHCASALAAASPDFVAVTGDRDLLRAWSELGLVTVDTANPAG